MAIDALIQEANSGSIYAQYQVGLIYLYGGDVPKDTKEAAKWFQIAADNKHLGAKRELGILYLMGDGVEPDSAKAYEYLQAAAQALDPSAMYHLGLMYEKGIGVERNLQESMRMLAFAANTGFEGAAIDADRVEALLTEERDEKLKARPLDKLIVSEDDIESACCQKMLDDIMSGSCAFMDTYKGPAIVSENAETGFEEPLEKCPHCGKPVETINKK